MVYETFDGVEISTETNSFLYAVRAEMEEVVDDLKLKPGTVFSIRQELKPKKGSTYKQPKLDSL